MGRVLRHPVSAGLVGGLVWGVVMRAWMRYITTDPEFSWSGTLFIVGATTFVGALLGFARYRRRLGGIGWWRFSILGLLLLGAGGSVMWPSVILGAIALGITRPVWARWLLGAGAVVTQVPVMAEGVVGNWRLSDVESVLAILWYAPMLAVEVWAFSVVFSPKTAEAPATGRIRRLALGLPFVFSGVLAVAAGLVTG